MHIAQIWLQVQVKGERIAVIKKIKKKYTKGFAYLRKELLV